MSRLRILATLYLLAFLLVALALPAPAQQASPNPCALPEQHKLDFWLGDWDLTYAGPDGKPTHGSNHIHRILDDCVVQENFVAEDGTGYRGMSVSLYDVNRKAWHQTWVDNQASYLDMVAEDSDGVMAFGLDVTRPNGTKAHNRMVWRNVRPDSLDWTWESSTDGGKTWKPMWQIHYQRKGVAAAK